MKNHIKLEFDAVSENELFARNVVAFFVLPAEPDVSELSDIKTAVSEAVTKCIVHAYKGKSGKIRMECALDGRDLHIEIADDGCGIEDVNRAIQPFFTTLADDERSGMGFTIMQTFMSELDVKSVPGEGTRVSMRKEIGAGKKGDA